LQDIIDHGCTLHISFVESNKHANKNEIVI